VRAIIGELKLALADCDEAIRLNPKVAAVYDSRGLTYLKMRQWQAAMADFTSALQLNPKLASSLYGRGLAKLRSGDLAGGKTDMAAAHAIEANIENVFAQYHVR
jgi:tetratricopeptide (TPR) repeat protein